MKRQSKPTFTRARTSSKSERFSAADKPARSSSVKKSKSSSAVAPKVQRKKQPTPAKSSSAMSLSKYVALSGVCSRRKAVEYIQNGSVKVNNDVVKEPGYKVEQAEVVTVNGQVVRPEEKIYIVMNKPKDYITTLFDEKGRKTVMDLIKIRKDIRLYPVGRLDRATTGILILTNDGELALKLSHPRYEVTKTYQATLDRSLDNVHLKKIGHEGVNLEDGHVDVDVIGFMPGEKRNVVLLDIHSGKNHVVRRIFEEFGYTVKKLDRVAYAGLTKKGLKPGASRYLTPQEIGMLKGLK
jgi:23S rRNA pseudouridine2605 synthase